MAHRYRVGEVAQIAGVSIRTLHHYDRIGLLQPAGQSEGGHRLYDESDLLRLQQILMLRLLGFSLSDIGELLERDDLDLVASLRIQRQALRDRIADLEKIDDLIHQLLLRRLATDEWDWALVAESTAAIGSELDRGSQTMEERWAPEQIEQFRRLGEKIGPEEIRETEERWTELLNELRAARDLDPASPKAQALLERWDAYQRDLQEAYASEPGLWEAIGEKFQAGEFEETPYAPHAEDFALIERIREAGDEGA